MEVENNFVFQADSDIVNKVYNEEKNYLINYHDHIAHEYCVLYFASNDLYYPNTPIAFAENIIKKNRFEWFGTRVEYAHKHIFIRDIKKQWYLSGINGEADTPGKLFLLLKQLTQGYKIITLGASAGGFAAVLYGQLLNAEKIYSFNGQFEINSLLEKSSAAVDPLIFRFQRQPDFVKYYDVTNFINTPLSIYYFQSLYHQWDIEQSNYVENIPLNKITFSTGNHGIPFLKTNLNKVLNLTSAELQNYVGKKLYPLIFSIKTVGIIKTIQGLNSVAMFILNKIYISTVQKWKKY